MKNTEKKKLRLNKHKIRIRIKKGFEIFRVILIIFFLVLAVLAVYNRTYLEEFMSLRIQQYGFIALFIVNFLLEFIPQFITPAVTLISSLFIGLNMHVVIVIVIFGSFLGSLLGYEIGLRYGFDILDDLMKKRDLEKTVIFMNKYGRIAVFLAAISPLPYIPMVIGALNMSRKNFVLFGLLPRAIGLLVLGYSFYLGILV